MTVQTNLPKHVVDRIEAKFQSAMMVCFGPHWKEKVPDEFEHRTGVSALAQAMASSIAGGEPNTEKALKEVADLVQFLGTRVMELHRLRDARKVMPPGTVVQ